MKRLVSLALLVVLGGCISQPPRNPDQAWVEVYSASYDSLLAETLDGATWGPGSYYQLSPGAHTLGLNFTYGRRFCSFSLMYSDFKAGGDYHLLAGWNLRGTWLHLLDEQGVILATDTCNSPFGN